MPAKASLARGRRTAYAPSCGLGWGLLEGWVAVLVIERWRISRCERHHQAGVHFGAAEGRQLRRHSHVSPATFAAIVAPKLTIVFIPAAPGKSSQQPFREGADRETG